jgi:hypothetical protein
MKLNIELGCLNRHRNIYRAIGEFLAADKGGASILTVDVFDFTRTEEFVFGRTVPLETPIETVGAAIGWDIHPCPEQVRLFRLIWDEETGMDDVTIIHDAPSSIVDEPKKTVVV